MSDTIILNCRGEKISLKKDDIKDYGIFKIFIETKMKNENEELYLNHNVKKCT